MGVRESKKKRRRKKRETCRKEILKQDKKLITKVSFCFFAK